MLPITCLIVDDEAPARRLLFDELRAFDDLTIVAEAATLSDAAKALEQHQPQVVFLDIQLGSASGFDLFGHFTAYRPVVVFVTAFDCHALRAFEVNALDYLLKPIDQQRFAATITRLRQQVHGDTPALPQGAVAPPLLSEDSILVEAGHSGAFVQVSDILWIDADGNYSSIVMANGRAHTHRQSLTEWEHRLPCDDFARIERGSIVQLKRIAAVTYEGRCAKCTFADSTVSRSFGRTASTRLRSLLRLRTQGSRVS